MQNEYITIKAFAEEAKVSVQSVYQRLKRTDNGLKPYLKELDGVKYISRAAISVLYKQPEQLELMPEEPEQVETIPEEPQEPVSENRDSNTRLLDLLEEQLKELRQQLQMKDKQISEQAEQITNLLTIVNQQQQLTAMQIHELPSASESELESDDSILEESAAKKSSIWRRWFGLKR